LHTGHVTDLLMLSGLSFTDRIALHQGHFILIISIFLS